MENAGSHLHPLLPSYTAHRIIPTLNVDSVYTSDISLKRCVQRDALDRSETEYDTVASSLLQRVLAAKADPVDLPGDEDDIGR